MGQVFGPDHHPVGPELVVAGINSRRLGGHDNRIGIAQGVVVGNEQAPALGPKGEQGEIGVLDAAQLRVVGVGTHLRTGARHPDGIGQRQLRPCSGRGLATAQEDAREYGQKVVGGEHDGSYCCSRRRKFKQWRKWLFGVVVKGRHIPKTVGIHAPPIQTADVDNWEV